MSEIRLVVREVERDWFGTMPANCADRAIAALSADPVTLEELEAAMERFAKRLPNCRFFANLSRGLCDEPYDAGLVVIDLVARLIVVDSTYSSPGPEGVLEYHNGQCCTEKGIRYHLADDWLFCNDGNQWRGLAEHRRRERIANPILDARAVFYGRPMLEFIAGEAFARREKTAADAIPQIHAVWLLAPREDLGGACPREIALERHSHLSWDLQDRCESWSSLRECPPGLEKSSHAYRLGGFGTHELVVYYDLVRELLWSCFNDLGEVSHLQSLTLGDFLSSEIPRLEIVRDTWLDTPEPEFHGRKPRSIVERERARLPEAMSGHEALVDPDCPCCQMMADMRGPAFWHLDGCNMDDDFAFDISHRTREEWDMDRKQWEDFHRKCEAERAERERIGAVDQYTNSIWSRSMCLGNTADVPLGIRIFGIGCRLAELIVGLRARADAQPHIDQLNRNFGNLREILQNADSLLVGALIDPVLDRFTDTLATAASARPELASQCESLTEEIHQLLDPPPAGPNWDSRDSGVPF